MSVTIQYTQCLLQEKSIITIILLTLRGPSGRFFFSFFKKITTRSALKNQKQHKVGRSCPALVCCSALCSQHSIKIAMKLYKNKSPKYQNETLISCKASRYMKSEIKCYPGLCVNPTKMQKTQRLRQIADVVKILFINLFRKNENVLDSWFKLCSSLSECSVGELSRDSPTIQAGECPELSPG